jgi:hypothetical protein
MSDKAGPLPSKRIATSRFIWLSSAVAGLCVFALALVLQWVIYDDWLHDRGPLRIIGSLIAGVLTFGFTYAWGDAARRHRLHQLQLSEQLMAAEDRVRNSLQTIECVTYARAPETTDPVRDAVDEIERTLEETFRDWPVARSESSAESARQPKR